MDYKRKDALAETYRKLLEKGIHLQVQITTVCDVPSVL